MKQTYTVWVGGIPDVEGVSRECALKIYREWVEKGFDDVIVEIDK